MNHENLNSCVKDQLTNGHLVPITPIRTLQDTANTTDALLYNFKQKLVIPQNRRVHFEVCLKKTGQKKEIDELKVLVRESVKTTRDSLRNWRSFSLTKNFENFDELDQGKGQQIERILVGCTTSTDGTLLNLTAEEIESAEMHFYTAKSFGAMADEISLGSGADDSSSAVGSHQWEIPCAEFDEIWEHLVFDDAIKNELLSYVYALLNLSDRQVNPTIIAVNRLVLLHGPPGTGKTSLCKALAQRLSVRLSSRYKRAIFVEVNSHSLFSKWFSESGKLILKLFAKIEELAAQSNWLVFVLIDEVESLTIGRNAAFSGSDPSDSVRAVNAVLTQLDRIKRFPNVLVFATSNISAQIDSAFLDRTDICRFVGNPSAAAARAIFDSAIAELQRINVLSAVTGEDEKFLTKLDGICSKCIGISGRSLRKLPVLAYSRCTQADSSLPIQMDSFLAALELAILETDKGLAAAKN